MGQRERQEAALLASNPGAPNTPPQTHLPPTAQLYTYLPLIGPQTHLPLAVNSHIALHPEKAGHSGSHSSSIHIPAQDPPVGAYGAARHGHGEHTGNLLRAPLRSHLPHQGRHQEGRGLCATSPGAGSISNSTLSPHALMA